MMNEEELIARMLNFFQLCAGGQQVSRTSVESRTYIYDNRVDHIPEIARPAVSFIGDEMKQNWYVNFLRLKFKFLTMLAENRDTSALVEQELGINSNEPHWKEILSIWRSEAPKERLAYLYRISQLGQQVVHHEWYSQLPEFLEWARLCRSTLENSWNEFLSDDFEQSYQRLWRGLAEQTVYPIQEDELLKLTHSSLVKGLSLKTATVMEHLLHPTEPGEKVNLLKEYFHPAAEIELSPLFTSPVIRLAEKLTLRYLEMLDSVVMDEDEYLQEFTKAMAHEFRCEISDFLVVVGDIIRIRCTSFPIPEQELIKELEDKEVYYRNEGITGSILTYPQPKSGLHVGTNNLLEDARQSPWHVNAYEKIYGKTYNFWVFPVFDNAKIVGAFRVINRGVEKDLSKGYWPYYVRLQLLEAAQWFENLWKVIRHLLPMMVMTRKLALSENRLAARELIQRFELGWVSEDYLEELLAHLITVVHRKVEDRRVGCCIGIVKEEDIKTLKQILNEYISIERDDIRDLSTAGKYYTRVLPSAGMFVFQGYGRFEEVLALQFPGGMRGLDAITKITDRFISIVFIVESDQRSARIFHRGEWAAEYYLSDRTGTWKLRFYEDTLKKLLLIAQWIQPAVIRQIYDRAWSLSYKEIGAMLVIADEIPENVTLDPAIRTNEPLENLSETEFAGLASIDGAVIISSRGIVSWVGAIIHIANQTTGRSAARAAITGGKGSRHKTASDLSSTMLDDALILVVSKNRGITIFYGAQRIVDDM